MSAFQPWRPIERLEATVAPDLRVAALDALREQWEQTLARATEAP